MVEENITEQGGLISSHRCDYLKNDQSQFLISSLKKRRSVETKAIVDSTIMDPLFLDSYPTPCNLLSIDNKKAQSKRLSFIPKTRSLNNLVRDNHFSCINYNPIKLKISLKISTMKKGGVVKFHPVGYKKNDLSQTLISSLKKRRIVETKAMIDSIIMDPLFGNTHPASTKTKEPNYKNAAGFFEYRIRSLNNLIRDNHFSCINYNPIKLKIT